MMIVLYWFLKLAWLLFIIFIGNRYLDRFGFLSVLIGIFLFVVGNTLINQQINRIMKRYFLKQFPELAEMRTGDILTVELKNGGKFIDWSFESISLWDLSISSDAGVEKSKKMHRVSLKHVRSIKKNKDVK